MKFRTILTAGLLATAASAMPAHAAGFINGGFEAGNASGWSEAGINRTSLANTSLSPASFTIGSGTGRSAVISSSYVDPTVGAALGSTVYAGNFAYRAEDTATGGLASLIQQRVNNYTDANIFFAWKSVLEGAHGINDAATMIISLRDLTTNTEIIRREYNAAAGGTGVDPRFASNGTYFYTPQWQIEQLAIGSAYMNHDFLLSVIAADCQLTGHLGYVYLDGFGAVTPPAGAVPEPATWAMMLFGFGALGGVLRRQRSQTKLRVRYAV